MRVVVYVEGVSDKLAMEALLRPLIELKQQQGISIEFFPVKGQNSDRGGDAKKDLLLKAPKKAVDIIRNDPSAKVVVIPDLYPKNKGFPHETSQELSAEILNVFNQVLQEKEIQDYRLQDRFKVFCFKYDLEALILAAKSALENVLGGSSVETNWQIPVEDQNHDLPPKMVVETIFRNQGKCYKGTVHASLILGQANYQELAEKCFQCFKPFVAFLEALSLPTIEIS